MDDRASSPIRHALQQFSRTLCHTMKARRNRFRTTVQTIALIASIGLFPILTTQASVPFRIAFGSCAHQAKQQPIWDAILQDKPDVFILLGDNIYGDTEDMDLMARKYDQFNAIPGFQKLRSNTRLIGTWDDHDYGMNDAGKEYPEKESSRRLMLSFFQEPEESPRWTQPGGVYAAYLFQHGDKTIQVILLDTRWDRDPLLAVTREEFQSERAPLQMGPYIPHTEAGPRMLGEEQWQWLEAQLQQPADLRIIGSSIQVLTDYSGWECWANFPAEQQRLLDLLHTHQVEGVFLVSGDTHWAEFSRIHRASAYPLWELTSSGLTEEWKDVSPNLNRVGPFTWSANYGLLEVMWGTPAPYLTASIKNTEGALQFQNTLLLKDLSYSHQSQP
jgi:alkaline phosphatase D